MRKSTLLLAITFASVVTGYTQTTPFSLVPTLLKPMEYSSCAWGDYDNDGDLDALTSGGTTALPITCLYQNNNGELTEVYSGLPGFSNTTVEWGDHDADGDLDILITGMNTSGEPSAKIFNNEGGSFTDAGTILPGIYDGQATWGDYDNDGDLDILMAGNSVAKIFRNDGTATFTDIAAPLIPIITASCSWVDYNNDGQLDALISGDSIGGMLTKLYRNDQGLFSEVNVGPLPFMGLSNGKCKWADMNNDGRQDLILSGMDMEAFGHLVVYKNDGSDQFSFYDNMTSNLRYSAIDVADFDADGLPDIMIIGKVPGCGGQASTMLFQNLGFMQFLEILTDIPGFSYGGLNWGDYNNDGYSDLIFTGMDGFFAPTTAIWKNNAGTGIFSQNTPPTLPSALEALPLTDKVVLTWSHSTDGQTPSNALSYNLLIGTQAGISDMFPAMASPMDGFRRIVAPGSCTLDTTWTITGLPAGDYWFSVQAIDNGFMPGAFANPVAFSYTPVGVEEKKSASVRFFPNPFRDELRMQTTGTGSEMTTVIQQINGLNVRIFNQMGEVIFSGAISGSINTANWPKGLYLLQVIDGNEPFSIRLIKQ